MMIEIDDEIIEGLCDILGETDPREAVITVIEYELDRFDDKRAFVEEHRRLLGKAVDKEVAPRLGVCEYTVFDVRHALGVRSKNKKSTKAEMALKASQVRDLLQTRQLSNKMIARRVGCNPGFVARVARELPDLPRRRTAVDEVLAVKNQLGKRTDVDIAREVGVPSTTVSLVRRKLGIPAVRRRGSVDLGEVERLLGEGRSTTEIAILLESSVETVRRARRKLGGD